MDRSLEEMLSEWLVLANESLAGPWNGRMRHNVISHGKGECTALLDEPPVARTVKRTWQDDENRRCTQFIAEVHIQAASPELCSPTTAYIAFANPAFAKELIAAVRSRLSPVQGEELPELDVTEEDKHNAYIALQYVGTDGPELLGATQRVFCRERQLRAAYAEIKRLSQPPAGLPERPQPRGGDISPPSADWRKDAIVYLAIEAETHFDALEAEIRRLKGELTAMTEDRNLWQDAHDEDCPNKALLSASRADALKAVRSLYSDELSVQEAAMVAQAESKLLALDGAK